MGSYLRPSWAIRLEIPENTFYLAKWCQSFVYSEAWLFVLVVYAGLKLE